VSTAARKKKPQSEFKPVPKPKPCPESYA
jgi:hypothetical protein